MGFQSILRDAGLLHLGLPAGGKRGILELQLDGPDAVVLDATVPTEREFYLLTADGAIFSVLK